MVIITMQDFLKNPTGKSSASFANRPVIIADLETRYTKLNKNSMIEKRVFKDKGSYIFHYKIPSEKYGNRLKYDVVIIFLPVGQEKDSLTINNYAMKMFSNSPAFVYTYAYVFNQDKNIPKQLLSKLNKICLKKEPKVKNPFFTYGFEKSIYFSLLDIKSNNLNLKKNLEDSSVPILKSFDKDITSKVSSSDDIMEITKKIQNEEKAKRQAKKKENSKKQTEASEKRTTKKLHTKVNKTNSMTKVKKSTTNTKKTKPKKKSVTSTLNKHK